MILTIDTGGTKTRLATFQNGKVARQIQYPTPRDPDEYIAKLAETIRQNFADNLTMIVLAVPGLVKNGTVVWHHRLGWRNFHIADRLRKEFPNVKIFVQNDANLGAIGAASQLAKVPPRAVYLTLSTGIGAGFLIDGQISQDFQAAEPGHIKLNFHGILTEWEQFASGSAFLKQTGHTGDEVDDPAIWRDYAQRVALGLLRLVPYFHPGIIMIGGSMGTHFAKYGQFLIDALDQNLPKVFQRPQIVAAQNPEFVVSLGALVYGQNHASD